jgi:hypothetical protein
LYLKSCSPDEFRKPLPSREVGTGSRQLHLHELRPCARSREIAAQEKVISGAAIYQMIEDAKALNRKYAGH